MKRSPNDQRCPRRDVVTTSRWISGNGVEQWNEVLKRAFIHCFDKEPRLSDYTHFHKEKSDSGYILHWKDNNLGKVVRGNGGKLKFVEND
jgi:hypothetical protein